MLIVRHITVEGRTYPVLISDDSEALHAAYAAGGAIIGIWKEAEEGRAVDYSCCLYMVTEPELVDERMLSRTVRRRKGMPWIIGETNRLLIREFKKDDPLETADQTWISEERADVFTDRIRRDVYIDSQYRFYECGLWALVDRATKTIVGKAGITGGELGYHIYPAFRRQGYAKEGCEKILAYARDEMELKELFLKTNRENYPSISLAAHLGFVVVREEDEMIYYGRRL